MITAIVRDKQSSLPNEHYKYQILRSYFAILHAPCRRVTQKQEIIRLFGRNTFENHFVMRTCKQHQQDVFVYFLEYENQPSFRRMSCCNPFSILF